MLPPVKILRWTFAVRFPNGAISEPILFLYRDLAVEYRSDRLAEGCQCTPLRALRFSFDATPGKGAHR